MGKLSLDVNIQEPRWDQSTFLGRARHFFTVTDPRNLLLSGAQLEAARNIVQNYRAGVVTPGLTEDQLWRAKHVYDSAFHPDTGEKVVLIGRMSAQVPMNMTITGCMLTFYRKTPTVVFWQWVNQSFNAVVNYSNRSGDAPVSTRQLGTAYVSATTGAVATALGLKSLTQHLPSLVGRFVPFAAVAAANCINIPLMRQSLLGKLQGKRSGLLGAVMLVMARGGCICPAESLRLGRGAIPPVIMDALEKKDFLKCRPWLGAPLQVGLVGFCLVFATPLCCALFPQRRPPILFSSDRKSKLRFILTLTKSSTFDAQILAEDRLCRGSRSWAHSRSPLVFGYGPSAPAQKERAGEGPWRLHEVAARSQGKGDTTSGRERAVELPLSLRPRSLRSPGSGGGARPSRRRPLLASQLASPFLGRDAPGARRARRYPCRGGLRAAPAAASEPQILSQPHDVWHVTGQDVMFGCEVFAYPMASIEWRKDGLDIQLPGDDPHISVQFRGGPQRFEVTSWLQIQAVRPSDEGAYRCLAQNALGQVEALAALTVLTPEQLNSTGTPQQPSLDLAPEEEAGSEEGEDYY
ncbi:Sideroflexin-3 [Heterocephalus glaber]|uniref:Sideroflexin-3 n=1 Tax=Heterocephalus glaber TaxID=10181 RepID=G5CAF3_HETGA|nr:Sideroflexin-3 [Heterocephalus glaber]